MLNSAESGPDAPSIYVSSPVLVWLGIKPDSFLKSGDDKDEAEAQPA